MEKKKNKKKKKKKSTVNFCTLCYFHQNLTITHICPPKVFLTCNTSCCKICPIYTPTQSFSRSNTNLSYPNSTLDECKSSNLVFCLLCMKCNAFLYWKNRSDALEIFAWIPVQLIIVNSHLSVPMKFLIVEPSLLPILIPLGTKYSHQDPVIKYP